MNLYVAGASREWLECRGVMEELRSHGHIITQDWTVQVEEVSKGAPMESPRLVAQRDLDAISECDMLVLVKPARDVASQGCWFEAGYALASSIPVLLLSHEPVESHEVFLHLSEVQWFLRLVDLCSWLAWRDSVSGRPKRDEALLRAAESGSGDASY